MSDALKIIGVTVGTPQNPEKITKGYVTESRKIADLELSADITRDELVKALGIKDGENGYSPTVTVTQTDSGAIITIIDERGTTNATINNGKDAAVETPDPNRHAEYFDITAEGVLSLKTEYRGASSNATYVNSVSDRGAGYVGSLNSELPKDIVIPEVVNRIAVVTLSSGMFLDNTVIESLTFPSAVEEIPEQFANQAYNLKTLNNTERIKVIGDKAFRSCRLEKVYLPNLETLSGIATFANNPTLITAEVGKVTTLPTNTFGMAQALREVTSARNVKTIGQQALYNTPMLEKLDFISGVTSIAKGGVWRSGFDYDWSSLTNCTFGDYATTKKANPTDFWSAYNPTPCVNPLPTRFCQRDNRWANKEIGTSGKKYGASGCGVVCAIHAYCGIKNLTLSSVDEFEEIVNSVNPDLLNNYDGSITKASDLLDGLGLDAVWYASATGWSAEKVNTLYETLSNGGYVIITVGVPSGHTIVVYGVNEKKELLYIDSERFYFSDTAKFSMGKLPFEKLIVPKSAMIFVNP